MDKLNKEILRLAVPSILAGITVPLVGMVDIAVVGHLGAVADAAGSGAAGAVAGAVGSGAAGAVAGAAGAVAGAVTGAVDAVADAAGAVASGGLSAATLIGGISVGTMLFDLLYWNFGFLRTGTGGLTAQTWGRLHKRGGGKIMGDGACSGDKQADGKGLSCSGGKRAGGKIGLGFELSGILARALRIALVSGLLLIALQWVVIQLAFLVVQCSPEVRQLATQYFYIRIWAAPATLSLFAFKGWFIGLQDSVRPMIADLLVNGLNILLSIVLAFGLPLPGGLGGSALASSTLAAGLGGSVFLGGFWGGGASAPMLIPALGFSGVAIGTVIAQWVGFIYCLIASRRRYAVAPISLIINNFLKSSVAKRHTCFHVSAEGEEVTCRGADGTTEANTPDWAEGKLWTMNRDLILRSLGMMVVYIGFTVLSARMGDMMLAVSTILMKLLMLFSYFTDGIAYAGEALTGRFIGERNREGVRATVRSTFAWAFGLAGMFMLLYGFGGVPAFRLMTSDNSVVEAGRQFLPWLLLMPLIGCPAFNWDGIFIGATASKDLRNSTLLCAVGFFAVWFAGLWLFQADALQGVASAIGNVAAGATAVSTAAIGAVGTVGATSIGNLSPELALHILMAAYFMHLAIRAIYLTLRYKPSILSPLTLDT